MSKKNHKVLILGGSGYLGNGLLHHLSKNKKIDLISYSRNKSQAALDLKIPQINGNILDIEVINKIKWINPEVIINFISLDHSDSELDLNKTLESNITPFWKICMEGIPSNLKTVMYFSTTQVYGQHESKNINELTEIEPKNIYGLSHKFSEDINSYYGRKLGYSYFNFRLSNSFGYCYFSPNEGKGWNYVINDLMSQAVMKNSLTLISDGTPSRDFISVEYIFEVVERFLESPSFPSGNYNLSLSKNYSIIEIANMIKEIFLKEHNKKLNIIINQNEKVSRLKLVELLNSKSNTPIISNKKLKKQIAKFNLRNLEDDLISFSKKIIKNESKTKH